MAAPSRRPVPFCRYRSLGPNELPAYFLRTHATGIVMRAWHIIRFAVVCYVLLCIMLAASLGEFAFRPLRAPVRNRSAAKIAARFSAALENVSITASDGNRLGGWFAKPAKPNGDAVILLHGVGDNRQGMVGFAELFLSKGFAVLMPDSRGQGES